MIVTPTRLRLALSATLALVCGLALDARGTDPPGAEDGVPLNLCDVIVRPGRPFQ